MHRLTSLSLSLLFGLTYATIASAQSAPAATATATSTDPICFESIDQATDPVRYQRQVKTCTQQIPGGEATSMVAMESSSSTSPDGLSSESSYSYSSSSSVTTSSSS